MAKKTTKTAAKKNPPIIIRVEPGLKRALMARSKRDKTTQAASVRTALEKFLGMKAA